MATENAAVAVVPVPAFIATVWGVGKVVSNLVSKRQGCWFCRDGSLAVREQGGREEQECEFVAHNGLIGAAWGERQKNFTPLAYAARF